MLLCARIDAAPFADDIRALLGSSLDWTYLDPLIARHGLAPLVHRHIEAIAPGAVPRAVLASLWARHEATARRNRSMAIELCEIVSQLEANGIAALPYKGPALAVTLYGDIALREFGDLDILVRRRDVAPARALLQSRGYVPLHSLTPALEAALVRSRRLYELPLADERRRMLVELHWQSGREAGVLPPDDDRWWDNLPTVPFEGIGIRVIPDRELLLALSLHGTKHHWSSLGWLVDIAELMRRPHLDWAWIATRARALGCERRVGLGFHLAGILLDAPMSAEARALASDKEVRRIGAEISRALFEPEFRQPGVFQALRIDLSLCAGKRQRLRHLVGSLFTPGVGEWTRWPLPRALFFLYFPLRVARLAGKYFFGLGAKA